MRLLCCYLNKICIALTFERCIPIEIRADVIKECDAAGHKTGNELDHVLHPWVYE